MKKLTSIQLGLENCEVIDIPANLVEFLHMTGYDRQSCWHGRYQNYYEIDVYNEILIELSPKINLVKQPGMFSDQTSVMQRLAMDDIVSIHLSFEDDKTSEKLASESYYVIWDGPSDYVNSYQDSHINTAGNLCIKIAKKSAADFLKESIENCGSYAWFEWDQWSSCKQEEGNER